MQPGDVNKIWYILNSLKHNFNYNPTTCFKKGVFQFINWNKDNLKSEIKTL